MKVSKYSLREKVKVHASRLRKGVWRCRVQPHRFLAPFPNSSRRFSRSIRAIGRDRPVVSKQATRLIELRGGYRDGGREGIDSGDPRSRLLRPEDGKREFALTQKNLCHSFNGAALRHPALLRDCNVRFDSLRGRINFILRLSSCTRRFKTLLSGRALQKRSLTFRKTLQRVDGEESSHSLYLLFAFLWSFRRKRFISFRY